MTRTEQRLADALAARAQAVDTNSVRPLAVTDLARERRSSRSRKWLAPAAAAISIALVAGVVAAVSGLIHRAGPEPAVTAGPPIRGGLLDVDALSAANIWAVGGVRPYQTPAKSLTVEPLIMHWDGTRWRRVAAPAEVGGGGLSSIAGSSANDLWAVGDWNGTRRDPGRPLIAHWNGKNWRLVRFAAGTKPGGLSSVSARSATDVWAVGESRKGALILHWDGRSWQQLAAPDPNPSQFMRGVAAISASDAWAVGSDGDVELIMHWNGSVWRLVRGPSPHKQVTLLGLAAASDGEVWAAENDSLTQFGVRLIHWNGTAWHLVPDLHLPPADGLVGLAVNSPSDIWAAGASNKDVLIMHWNGRRWSQSTGGAASLPGIIFSVAAASASDVWAVGWHGTGPARAALILHWNGKSWTKVVG